MSRDIKLKNIKSPMLKIVYQPMKILISIVSILSAIIVRSYLVYLYGTMCGVNLFNWNTWGKVFHGDSFTCQSIEWAIHHSRDVLISVGTAFGLFILTKVNSITQ